ncbi:MAG: UDP-N-acetylmuramoyl-tripeptide--D-alanyl-D-alanine ligase [Candidatus Binatia bacterium]
MTAVAPAPGSACFTLAEVLAATGGELERVGAHVTFAGVTTDSRAVGAGQLFVAIRGDTHDGHAFAAQAAARGAGAVLVESGVLDPLPPGGVITVRDTLAALGDLAAAHRRRRPARVVAITGSNGKTTTKEMLTGICGRALGEAQVLRTRGTQNNLVGLPLTLLRLGDGEAVAIVECGMNGPGEIWRLAEIASPDVGVITCVSRAHLEGLGSLHGIAEAKAELYRRLRPSAVAVVNADDPHVAAAAECFPGRTVRFGMTAEPATLDVQALDVADEGLEGLRFRLRAGDETTPVRLALPGRHNVTNALAAAAAAHALGIRAEAIAAGLATFRPPAMRMEVQRTRAGLTIVNDAYNANPASMAAALAMLAATPAARRAAALGEMRELGAATAAAHAEVGAGAARAGLDALFLLGAHAAATRDGAIAAGLPPDRIVVAATHEELASRLRAWCRAGDVLLLKGSRGSAMEEVLPHLDPELDP